MLDLSPVDNEMLSGSRGEGARFAMETLVSVGEAFGAERFIDIEWAHVASAYCHTQANIDFARKLTEWGTIVSVPTTLTTCSFDPRNPSGNNAVATELIELYTNMGCEPALSCAPYHTRDEPGIGAQLAWCESSAVVYANSVLGARTNCYVEFVDMCAAITGRVPECGLHQTANRKATVVFELHDLPEDWFADEWMFHSLGILVGSQSGDQLPAITGLKPDTTVEQLRALGSAAASSGSVSMFHAVGITPEAPTLNAACQDVAPQRSIKIVPADIVAAAASLCTPTEDAVTAICVGAPHFSPTEFRDLASLLDNRQLRTRLIAATSAVTLGYLHESGLLRTLEHSGVEFVTGRCTYYRPIAADLGNHVMTNSAKWAWYAPSDLDVAVTFASLSDCVERACSGE
jgi:predicted aconitase